MPRRSARGRARRPQPGTGVRARRAPVSSAALRRLAAVSAPCWRWGRPAWSRRRGSLLSALRVPDGFLEGHLDGVPVGAGVGRVGGDAVLYGGGVLRGELPGLDRLPRRTLSSQQVVGEIEGTHGPESMAGGRGVREGLAVAASALLVSARPIRCSGGARLTGRCLVRRRLARSRPTAHQRRRARTGLCGGGGAASGVPLRWPCPDSGRWLATGQRVRNDGGKPPPRSEDLTMPKKPSQPWRLVLTTPSVPVYTKHRSKPAAYRA